MTVTTSKNLGKAKQLIVVGLHEVLPLVGMMKVSTFKGHKVRLDNRKLKVFKKKGVTCCKCGCKGLYFVLEEEYHPFGDVKVPVHFLNLYAHKEGREVLMTMDHIKPQARGGKNGFYNLQPMCIECNQKKADAKS